MVIIIAVRVLLSTTNCSTWRGDIASEIPLTKSVIIK